jgi:hypothetical protein
MNPMLPNNYDFLFAFAALGSVLSLVTPLALIWILIEVRKIRKIQEQKHD